MNKTKILEQSRAETIASINNNKDLTQEQKWDLLEGVDKRYKEELAQVQDEARKMGNLDLLLNIPILMADNFYTFGKFYSKGFSTAKQNMKKNVRQEANRLFTEAENPLREGVQRAAETGQYVWNDITKKQAIGKGLMSGLREGNEELAQAMAAEFSSNLYSDTPDSYYKAISDPNAEREALSTYESLTKAFADTYGNMDRYEEFAIGALTGLLGTPTFGRVQNADANTYLGRGKMVGLSGGIFGEIATANDINKRGSENTQWMNKLQDRVQNNKENLMMKKAFVSAMDGWSATDNKFEYKNQEDNEMWRSINAFLSTGRRDDLMQMMSVDFEHMPKEELENIAKLTSPNDYGVENGNKNTTGWRDANGNYLTDTDEGTEQMRQSLIKKRESIKKDIERYDKALSTVRSISNNNVNQNESEVSELAWLLWKGDKFKSRIQELKEEFGNYGDIDAALQEYQEQLQDILKSVETSPENTSLSRAIAADMINARNIRTKKDAVQDLDYITSLRGILKGIAESNEKNVPIVQQTLANNVDWLDEMAKNDALYNKLLAPKGMSRVDYEEAINALRDTGRLSQAYKNFQDKFNEYSKDPLKQKANRAKIDAERQQEQAATERTEQRTAAKSATRSQIVNMTTEERDATKAAMIAKLDSTASDEEAVKLYDDVEEAEKTVKLAQKELAKRAKENKLDTDDIDKMSNVLEQLLQEHSSEEIKDPSTAVFFAESSGTPFTEE